MANTISVLNPANWRPIVQDFLNNILVATKIANTEVRAELADGDTVNFPQMSDLRVQSYTQGTDLTIDALNASQSALSVDQSKAVTMAIDPVQERQAKAKYAMNMAKQAAFRLANQIDKKLLGVGVAGANNTIVGGTPTSSTMYSLFTSARAQLFRNNATDGSLWAVLDAARVALLAQTFVANGFVLADNFLKNSFSGMAHGFEVYTSNNLPSSVGLTVSVLPTAGDTFTVYGVTFTFVATGTATNPGEISLGANIGATQPTIVTAINGTGTPGVSTYIDVSTDDRRILQNNDVLSSTFSGDVTTITAVGLIAGSETFTSGSNVFGTETTQMLFGRQGAISLGMQMEPNLYIKDEPKQLARNYITHTLFGAKVFSRDAFRLVKITHNA